MKQSFLLSQNSSHKINTLVDLLQSRADQHPDDLAYRFIQDNDSDIVTITYGELDRRARAIGAWLESLGASGERALLLYPPVWITLHPFSDVCMRRDRRPCLPAASQSPCAAHQSIVDNSHASFALTTIDDLSNIEQRFEHAPDLGRLSWLNTDQVPAGIGSGLASSRYYLRHAGIPPIYIRLHQPAQRRHVESWQPDAQPESHSARLSNRLK